MKFDYLKKEYLEAVINIIVAQYQEARHRLPMLSEKYESHKLHEERLSQYMNNPHFIIGLEDDKVVGFIYGFFAEQYKGTANGALVLPSFHGVINECDKERVYDELYREASRVWSELGYYTHSILLYKNHQELINHWVLNGFGMYVIDAVRDLSDIAIPEIKDDIEIRMASDKDLPVILKYAKETDSHLMNPPVFLLVNLDEDIEQEYREWVKRDGNHLWVACKGNDVIGYLKTNTTEINQDELNDGYTMGINGAYVKNEYRKHYIMSRLINLALQWARENGLKRCSTDFESANIEGRNFWLRNFTPYSYALIRRIDERIYLK